jgi:uncharacterized protein YjbJ (UPF0337 family)
MTGRNKLRNRAQYWGGRAKETVGKITDNRRTKREGKLDQVKANLKNQRERVKDTFLGSRYQSGGFGGSRTSPPGSPSGGESFKNFLSRRS